MIKEIKYNGYSAQPSDYECPDGDLAVAINLVPEDGALKPVGQPKVIRQFTAGTKVIFIHNTSAFTHYIVNCGNSKLGWVDAENSSSQQTELSGLYDSDTLSHVNAVGNTLLVFTKTAIHYYLWKKDKYIFLGDHIPNIELSFGLRGAPRLFSMYDDSKATFKITFDGIAAGNLFETWTESNQNKITSQVMGKVNKFLADQTVRKGKFALPFFVRYALRLYDGSLVGHSAPILMNPSTTAAPILYWDRIRGENSYTEAICDIMLVAATLDYLLLVDNQNDYANLKNNWSDIIKSVDVFISKPIYTYDQNGLCKSFHDTDDFDSKFIGTLDFEGFSITRKNEHILLPLTIDQSPVGTKSPGGKDNTLGQEYVEWEYSKLYELFFAPDRKNRTHPASAIMLPQYSDDKNRDLLKNVSQFYFLHSIKLSDLSTSERKDIIVDDEYLQSLVTREAMTDDYLTHDRLAADFSHTYNARLNLSGVRRELFKGFSAPSMLAYTSCPPPGWTTENENLSLSFPRIIHTNIYCHVYIKEDGNVYMVSNNSQLYTSCFLSDKRYGSSQEAGSDTNAYFRKSSWGCYVFYPNVNAFKIVLEDLLGKYEIDLKPHDFLNGAFAVLDYELERLPQQPDYPDVTTDNNFVDMPNKIYTSEVNNPFYFPLLGINTVGTGKILGISSAAKALSEGQFGQFPLYAFTTEGVWAMELGNTGLYSARQPITRDVCINPDGITQIDSSVLFPTDRGIMLISGSQTLCITDTIKTESPFNLLSLPHMKELHDRLNHDTVIDKYLSVTVLPFTEFLKSCRMIYDYVHQRIIVYNAAVTYAYVYSLKSKLWGMIYSAITDNVNSYPDALAMDTNGNLVNFAQRDDDNKIALILVTRPLKLDMPNILKTIDTVIQRGHFQKGNVQSVLYGSRDLCNWHLVWSSKDHYMRGFRGTPYKYFRIALLCSLSHDESIYGASVQFQPRLTNQPR